MDTAKWSNQMGIQNFRLIYLHNEPSDCNNSTEVTSTVKNAKLCRDLKIKQLHIKVKYAE